MCFYKRPDIKNRSKYNEIVNLELSNDDYYLKIVEGVPINVRDSYDYNHDNCYFKTPDSKEKRLCRCLVGYNNPNSKAMCDICALKDNPLYAKKVLNAKMIDFEIPVSNSGEDKVGEIDLAFEYDKKLFLAEFKPIKNSESILRMVAEILTYTHVLGYKKEPFLKRYKHAEYEKAIVFVKGSQQWKQWADPSYKHYACERLREIIKKEKISVFCLDLKESGYYLEKLN